MNKEVYEANDKYCVVMSDNREIKVLSKDNNDDVFSDYLNLDNKLEETINDKNTILSYIKHLNSKDAKLKMLNTGANIAIKTVILICACTIFDILVYPGMSNIAGYIRKTLTCSAGVGLLIIAASPIIYKIYTVFKTKKLNKGVTNIDNEINKLTKSLAKMKEDNQIKDVLTIDGINKETANKLNKTIESDSDLSREYEVKKLKEIRQVMVDYLSLVGEKEEKGRQYTIGTINK